MIAPVNEGVFFTTPEMIPKGRHGLEHDEVLRRQRERSMIAATELLAAGGYRSLGVRDLAGRARVSQPAFYESFEDKDACLLAAYDRFTEVLSRRMLEAVGDPPDWQETVARVVRGYLGALESDLVVARAFHVELGAMGRVARERQRNALETISGMLKGYRDMLYPGAEHVPPLAYAAGVHAVRQSTTDLLDAHDDPDLTGLADDLVPWLAAMLAG